MSLGQVKPTKTEESRTVDLTARLVEALRRWQIAPEADALLRGAEPGSLVSRVHAGRCLT